MVVRLVSWVIEWLVGSQLGVCLTVRPTEVFPGQHGHVHDDSRFPEVTLHEHVWFLASRQRRRCELWLAGWLAIVVG